MWLCLQAPGFNPQFQKEKKFKNSNPYDQLMENVFMEQVKENNEAEIE